MSLSWFKDLGRSEDSNVVERQRGHETTLKYMRDEAVENVSNVAMAFLHSKRRGSQGEVCTRRRVGYLGCKQARG